ncbi:AT-rich interactive domain-containing protein cfi-1-like isoform X2 [Dermacentor variabilis]|uniref:AT-rich interactive domain-containing protein cfi-1-like isoform X2 n=1 Tax=Dermacentor variabilis TaxID=34621 RepID=UPI0021551348
MEHESDDMDGSMSNPEEEELNESEYGGSGDDDEERRTPLDGELSNDDAQSDVLARYHPHNNSGVSGGSNNGGNNGSVRSRQDDGSPVPLANNCNSDHSSNTPPAASNGSTMAHAGGLSSEPRIPAPNAVVSSSPGPLRVPDSGPLSALAARAAASGATALLPAAAISALPLSQAPPLFSLATGAPHMMHLPPTLTPHTAAVSGTPPEPSKYAFEEHYGKHGPRSAPARDSLAASVPRWELSEPGKTTEFSRDFKVSPTPKSSRSSRSGDSNGRVSSMDDIGKLYELSDDPKRKEFLDDLFGFMQKRGTPVNRIPIMAKQVLDLFELYRLVVSRGGLVEVINKKIWREITKGLNLPSSITSAAFTLRTQYMKYLYPYECEKEKLSQPDELQAAIDGNRREGRRSSYSHYAEMMSSATAASLTGSRGSNHHTSPISLVCRQANGHAPPPTQHHAGGPSSGDEENSLSLFVPQQEALNLEVPRGGSADHKVLDPRRLLGESLGPPASKRFISSEEDSLLAHSMHTTHIKMNSRGDGRGQADNSMSVTMEVNGIIYHGVLYPQSHRNRLS